MSIQAISWAFEQKLPPTQKLVLLCLADYASEDGEVFPKQRTLAERCGVTRQTVNVALAKLEEVGLVKVRAQHRDDGGRVASRYHLNFDTHVGEDDTPCQAGLTPPVGNPDSYIEINLPKEPSTEPSMGSTSPKKATRLPENWSLSESARLYAEGKGLPPPRIELEAELFRNHWLAAAGQNARKMDWERAWMNWVLKAIEYNPPAEQVGDVADEIRQRIEQMGVG